MSLAVSQAVRLGPAISADVLEDIESHLHLHHLKWDTQVGDVHAVSKQPLIIHVEEWNRLSNVAVALAAETIEAEREIGENPHLLRDLGIPSPLHRYMEQAQQAAEVRVMRFDFHPTCDGWMVSEVNSDVPGGYGEATWLPRLFAPAFPGLTVPESPLDAWSHEMEQAVGGNPVALLCAPGYLEDEQVVRTLARELMRREIPCALIRSPEQLTWSGGLARLRKNERQVAAIVRFYQAEWLSRLPRSSGWRHLFEPGQTLVTNPARSVISESKRFPLAWDRLRASMGTWKRYSPECREPDAAPLAQKDEWVWKAAFSNTGDSVHHGSMIPTSDWARHLKKVRRDRRQWVAQRRFRTLALDGFCGRLFPCLGIYVINGKAAGAYVRLAQTQVTDCYALEAPLLIEGNSQPENHGANDGETNSCNLGSA